MAIQYYMRAYNTNLNAYVDWVVNDTPDSTGTFSGFPANQLSSITVNRVVQSKVANFLKPNQSLGGTDGYFFHINSYDWINATAPLGVPLNFFGFAVERGLNFVSSISTATNATPINVTTSIPHGLVTGQIVTIIGVTGNVNANGTWPITVTGSANFTLNGSTGSGAPNTLTGSVFTPKDMSTLIWDETNQLWRFAFNTNGDGVTLGSSQSVKVNNFIIDGFEAFGNPTALSGIIRLPNNQYIVARDSLNNADIQLIGADNFPTSTGTNRIKIGNLATDFVYMPGNLDVDGYIQHNSGQGLVASTNAFINDKNNTTIVGFRNQLGLADIAALGSNTLNDIVLGDAVNSGILYNTSTGNFHQFQVNTVPQFEIGTAFARFPGAVTTPTILQNVAAIGVNGQTLILQAQNAAGTGSGTGGNLNLTSGAGNALPTANGVVNVQTGSVTRITVSDNTETYSIPNITYASNVVTPVISQATTSAAAGQPLLLQAQNTTFPASLGGNLVLTSGTGALAANNGNVIVQSGGLTQMIVSTVNYPAHSFPTSTGKVTITGNLEVQGTLTTVDSTTVDIVGAVIHGNWSDPVVSPNVGIPTTVVGYSSHRGNLSGVPRDGASLIWTEGTTASNAVYGVTNVTSLYASDGYWRLISTPGDGFGVDSETAGNSLATLGVFANNFVATADPNPVLGVLPGTGGLRAPNNTTIVTARNVTPSTTIAAASNLTTLPQATITVASTVGFTTSGTLLIATGGGNFTTVTYTGGNGASSGGVFTSGTTFTGGASGSGTLNTGAYVTQAIASTTIAVGSNNTTLPAGTINVASTVGFPQSGTLRIVTLGGPGTPGVPGNGGGVQTVAYTGTSGGTQFTGCTGGTGYMYTGATVQLVTITGSADMNLVATDFGNHILWGAPTTNTGHIFNTPTGFIYDFQINSVSQVQLTGNLDASDSFIGSITIAPTVNTPKIYQLVQPNTGANAGFNLKLQAQAGQQQTGGAANNNGGNLVVASGSAGTGGGGAAGVNGTVDTQTGTTLKIRVFPTSAVNAGDSNSILYFENLFRVDTGQPTPTFRQDATASATGQTYTIQAQNAVTTGGILTLTSGTGATAGNVQVQTGGATRVLVTPTFTSFLDTAEALRITPVSAGTTQITYASTDTAAQINQTTTGAATGATMTIQSQNAATTGGALTFTTGTGATNPGNMIFQIGGTTLLTLFNTAAVPNTLQWLSTTTSPVFNQGTTGGASGQTLTIQAQNAVTTGGNLTLTSGTGTTAGNVQIQTGAATRVLVTPTFTSFSDTAEALRITPVSAGTTQITYAATDTAAQINQTTTASTPSAPMTIQAQVTSAASGVGGALSLIGGNASGTTSTGGNLNLASGSGTTTNGTINFQPGGTTQVLITATGQTIQWVSTVATPTLNQATTASATGQAMTVQAQNAVTTGGALNLTSGTGSTANNSGNVNLQTGGTTVASAVPNKFVFNQGRRRHVTSISGTYTIVVTDDFVAINTASAPFTVALPASPTTGDEYQLKDTSGNAGTNNVNISGNGNNIDGVANFSLNQAYESLRFTFTGSQWSVS